MTNIRLKLKNAAEKISPYLPAIKRWFYIAFFVYLALVILNTCLAPGAFMTVDDVYITLRYSDHLREGLGFFYNAPGEGILATTTPLMAILAGLIGLVWERLDFVALTISAASLWLAVFFTFLIAKHYKQAFVGIIAGVLIVTSWQIVRTFGMETSLFLFLFTLDIYLFIKRKYFTTGVVAGLLTLTRPDGIFLVAILGLIYLVKKRQFPAKALYGFLAVLVPWAVYAWVSIGTIIPSTVGIKYFQGETSWWSGMLFGKKFFTIFLDEKYVGFTILAFLGTLMAAFRKKAWLLIIISWAAIYAIAYAIGNVPGYHWYFTPLFFVLYVLVAAAVTYFVMRLLEEIKLSKYYGLLMVVILALAIAVHAAWRVGPALASQLRNGPDFSTTDYHVYRHVGDWLRENTEEGSTIGTTEIGIIGFYAERTIIDLVGLATPGVAEKLAQENFGWAISQYQPDYLVLHDPVWPISGATPEVLENYELVQRFEKNMDINIYRRR